jgi:outer membrane protein insertion porin family
MDFPLSLNSRGSLIYTLRDDDVTIGNDLCDPANIVFSSALCSQRGSFLTSSIGYGYRLDHRNDPVNPTRGFYMRFNQDFAGVGGDVKYVRSEGEGGFYHGFSKAFVLSVVGSAGYVNGWGGDHVRINDRFFKGGDSFRGFQIAGIGPRDLTLGREDALGGKGYAIGTVELTIPTFLPEQYGIRAALFSDVGTLGGLDSVDKASNGQCLQADCSTGRIDIRDDYAIRASAGVSVFWRSPMGPIRLDFSQIIKKQTYDKTELFRFSTGTRF